MNFFMWFSYQTEGTFFTILTILPQRQDNHKMAFLWHGDPSERSIKPSENIGNRYSTSQFKAV